MAHPGVIADRSIGLPQRDFALFLLQRSPARALGVSLAMGGLLLACTACTGAAGSRTAETVRSVDEASRQADGGAASGSLERTRWGVFHSRRFDLRLGLPDGHAWKIDDHRSAWLRADHAGSSSTLVARAWNELRPATRESCYGQARDWDRTLPDLSSAQVVDDAIRPLKGGEEARVTAGVEAARPDAGTTSGFVVVSVALVRKCVVVTFRTSSSDPEEVAARMAMVTSRLVPSIELVSDLAVVGGR